MPTGHDATRTRSRYRNGERIWAQAVALLACSLKPEQTYLLDADLSPINLERYIELWAVNTGDDRPNLNEHSRLAIGQAACMRGSMHMVVPQAGQADTESSKSI